MTRQEYTEHITNIVETVFAAENKLQPELQAGLKGRKISPREYCRRIAEEIVSATTDAELEQLTSE